MIHRGHGDDARVPGLMCSSWLWWSASLGLLRDLRLAPHERSGRRTATTSLWPRTQVNSASRQSTRVRLRNTRSLRRQQWDAVPPVFLGSLWLDIHPGTETVGLLFFSSMIVAAEELNHEMRLLVWLPFSVLLFRDSFWIVAVQSHALEVCARLSAFPVYLRSQEYGTRFRWEPKEHLKAGDCAERMWNAGVQRTNYQIVVIK